MDSQLSLDTLLVVDLLDANEGIVGSTFGGWTGDDDLLDQSKLERLYWVEAIDNVIRILMGRRVAKRTQRIQRPDGFLCSVRGIHALRFVDDKKRGDSPRVF